jgi:hypothetical protein
VKPQRVLCYLVFGAASSAAAWAVKPHILVDDAAISFRYAKRFGQGLGLTYNDHERVMGFSNPLYTLILAGGSALGVDLETAAMGLAFLFYVATILLSVYLAERLSDLLGAVLTGLLLLGNGFFASQALSGMETSLATSLGLLFVAMLFHGKPLWAGVVLGLAVINKLDAGLLALALLFAWVTVHHTLPWAVAGTAVAVFTPWVVFALLYYGAVIPNSLHAKAWIHSRTFPFDRWWIADLFRLDISRGGLLLGAALLPACYRGLDPRGRLVSLVLLGWFLLHATAYSLLNLGDYYPWYLTALFPSITVLAGAFAARLVGGLPSRAARIAISLVLLAAVARWGLPLRQFLGPSAIKPWEAFDSDRRLAGIFIDQFGDKNEVVASAFGWVAYEVDNPFDDGSGLNSKTMIAPDYVVLHGPPPLDRGFTVPRLDHPEAVPLATFNLASDLYPGHTWFSVFGRPGSRIARSGRRFLQYRLFQLERDGPARGDAEARLEGNDLVAALHRETRYVVVNEGQGVHVVYTPVIAQGPGSPEGLAVAFSLGLDGAVVHRQLAVAGRSAAPVIALLPGSERRRRFTLALSTQAPPEREGAQGLVRWQNAKVIIGSASVDLARMRDAQLRETWQRYNRISPVP